MVHETVDSAAAAAIADNIDVLSEHAKELPETEKNTIKVMPRYHNCVMEIIQWMERDYPREYDLLVFELSEEQKADLSRQYHKATHDKTNNPVLLSPIIAWKGCDDPIGLLWLVGTTWNTIQSTDRRCEEHATNLI